MTDDDDLMAALEAAPPAPVPDPPDPFLDRIRAPGEPGPRWFDRAGRPISMRQANALLGDPTYKIVKQEVVGPYRVSTVWLALDHNCAIFGDDDVGPPKIFETAVFSEAEFSDPDRCGLADFDMHRWSTETEALQGHSDVVTLVRAVLVEFPPEGPQEGRQAP